MRRRALLLLAPALLAAAASPAFERSEEREPCATHDPLRRPHFGDTHVHTVFSFDAWGQGTRNTPRDAYRFARGEAVGIQPYDAAGEPSRWLRLGRPLDFAIVTDHAELLGETHFCRTPGSPGYDSLVCRVARRWPKLGYVIVNSQIYDETDPVRYGFCGEGGRLCIEGAALPWRAIRDAAEEAYDRSAACRFTSFVGYEWTGNPDSSMIHRNVVFRNDDVPALPSSYVEDRSPENLWRHLHDECLARPEPQASEVDPQADRPGRSARSEPRASEVARASRCDVLVIPHNSNLSNGRLFAVENDAGQPLGREEAARRASLEVLLEVTQHKGDSECRAGGPSADEWCGFETLPFARMAEMVTPWRWTPPPRGSYARDVLGEGMVQERRLGVNPFKLGLIGSTDTHLGMPGLVDEAGYPGHAAGLVTRRLEVPPLPDSPLFNPGGLAVLWAEENSRDALFAAMRRRETYGTSGPRMIVRFFGGWDYPADLCQSDAFAPRGYAGGVPMGGDLPPPPAADAAPRFAVWALRDAGTPARPGVPLERIQIVKLSLSGDAVRERVFEVAGGDRGADVDLASCRPRGPGANGLCAVWRDPEFAAGEAALYYARVLENPSCRWNQYACNARGVDCADPPGGELAACCDPEVPRTIQERAWTSPIWYTPAP